MATRKKALQRVSVSIKVRLTPADHGRLIAVAEHYEQTASHVVRMLIRGAFAKLPKRTT